MSAASHPFVSVVTPIYNRRDWVAELLATIEKQTYPRDRFELIIVDDNSTDGAWEDVQKFASDSAFPVRCFRNETGIRGPGVTRNIGIEHAKGEIVAFIDSDCQADPNWLMNGVRAFSEGVGVVEGRVIPVPGDPRPALCKIKDIDGSRSLFDTSNILYTRDALQKVGGFSPEFFENGYPRYYGEDIDLGYRVKEAGWKRAFAADALVMHRNRPQSFRDWIEETRLVFMCPYLAKKHPTARRELLFLQYFLSPSTATFDLSLLGLGLAAVGSPWWAMLCVPFLVVKTRESGGRRPLLLPLKLAGSYFRALLFFTVLAGGSLRHRSLVI